jgi:hypothetical protein
VIVYDLLFAVLGALIGLGMGIVVDLLFHHSPGLHQIDGYVGSVGGWFGVSYSHTIWLLVSRYSLLGSRLTDTLRVLSEKHSVLTCAAFAALLTVTLRLVLLLFQYKRRV